MKSKLLCIWLLLLTAAQVAAQQRFGSVKLQINEVKIEVDYAWNYAMRAQGLMHRKTLCDDCGMYFRFDSDKVAAMWMKNTFIPLDVAYATRDGVITDIKPLTPHDLSAVASSQPVLYALEMNQGWFASKDIKVGDTIKLLEKPEH